MNSPAAKPSRHATALHDRLDPGEQLRWVGQPRQGIFLRVGDLYTIPFSLFFTSFAIFLETIAIRYLLLGKRLPLFAAILISSCVFPFIVAGLLMLIGRFFLDAWSRRHTRYAITNRRALKVSYGKFTSFDLESNGEVILDQHFDGTGTLTFGKKTIFMSNGRAIRLPGAQLNQFDHIQDASEAYRIVREVQQTAR